MCRGGQRERWGREQVCVLGNGRGSGCAPGSACSALRARLCTPGSACPALCARLCVSGSACPALCVQLLCRADQVSLALLGSREAACCGVCGLCSPPGPRPWRSPPQRCLLRGVEPCLRGQRGFTCCAAIGILENKILMQVLSHFIGSFTY